MKRVIAIIVTIVAALAGVLFFLGPNSDVLLSKVEATAVAGQPNMFMVTLNIQNDGDAVALAGFSAPEATKISVMNPGYEGASLVVPSQSQASFAMDGAHLLLMADGSKFTTGSLMPLTLTLGDGNTVTTRILNVDAGMAVMDHGASAGIEVAQPPSLSVTERAKITRDGGVIKLDVGDFEFTAAADNAAHVANQGHAHIYLNGLKLGRFYKAEFTLGALVPNRYRLRVALNTNDHRAYVASGQAIADVLAFDIPAAP